MGGSGISIMATAAIKPAVIELAPRFTERSGQRIVPIWIPTMDMLARLRAGEVVDVVLLTAETIDELTAEGIIARGSRVDIMRSSVGMAVKAGTRKPDISSVEAFKRSMLAARSIAYSFGPSGLYIAELFKRLGIANTLGERARQVKGIPIGELVAKGEAEIGFQQVSELLPVGGIDLLGALPAEIACVTVFSAGVHAKSAQPNAASALIDYLASREAAPVLERTGLEPLVHSS
jgi:molybdate transport system substrate-binding protein